MISYEAPSYLCEQGWLGLLFAVIESGYAEQDTEFIESGCGVFGAILEDTLKNKEIQTYLNGVTAHYINKKKFAKLMEGIQL